MLQGLYNVKIPVQLEEKLKKIAPDNPYSQLPFHKLISIGVLHEKFGLSFNKNDLNNIKKLAAIKEWQNTSSCHAITNEILYLSMGVSLPPFDSENFIPLKNEGELEKFILKDAGDLGQYLLHPTTLEGIQNSKNINNEDTQPLNILAYRTKGLTVYIRNKKSFSSITKFLQPLIKLYEFAEKDKQVIKRFSTLYREYLTSGLYWDDFALMKECHKNTNLSDLQLCRNFMFFDNAGSKICVTSPLNPDAKTDHIDFTIEERRKYKTVKKDRERCIDNPLNIKDSSRVHVIHGNYEGSFFEIRNQQIRELLEGTFGKQDTKINIKAHSDYKKEIYLNLYNNINNNQLILNKYLPILCTLHGIKTEKYLSDLETYANKH